MEIIKKNENKSHRKTNVISLSLLFLFSFFESCIASPQYAPDCFGHYVILQELFKSTPEIEDAEKIIEDNEGLYLWLALTCDDHE